MQITLAHATKGTDCDLRNSFRKGFLDISEVAKKSKIVATVMSHTVRITNIGIKDGIHCSASVISKKGHILTTSHCLDNCRMNWPPEEGGKLNKESSSFIQKTHRKGKYCSLNINGKDTFAEVIVMNPCEIEELYNEVIEKKKSPKECMDANDIAVLKVDPALVSNEYCTEISFEKVPLNAGVAAVGYPRQTSRNIRNTGDSNGVDVHGSFGRTVRWKYCELNNTKKRHTLDKSVLLWRDAFHGKLIQATTDIVQGSSGGPLIDAKGRIVAVTSGYISSQHGPESVCAGSSLFASVQSLEKSLANWGADLKKEDLTCQ